MSSSAKDAGALLAVQLGDGRPLVPEAAQRQGTGSVAAAAFKRLADMKRDQGRVLYRRTPHTDSIATHTRAREGSAEG